MDLGDLMQNTRDGLHIASLAGSWIAAVAGFGGMRDHGGALSFKPRLPRALVAADVPRALPRPQPEGRRAPGEVTYELLDGEPLEIVHDDEELHRGRRRHARVDAARRRPGAQAAARARAAPAASRLADRSIDRIDASSGSFASSSWMIRCTSRWSCPKSSRNDVQRRVQDLQLGRREFQVKRHLVGADEIGVHVPKRTYGAAS